jgi:hypothetical protein
MSLYIPPHRRKQPPPAPVKDEDEEVGPGDSVSCVGDNAGHVPLSMLTETQVSRLLTVLGLGKYEACCLQVPLRGKDLVHCQEEVLEAIGISFRPHRLSLLEEISRFTSLGVPCALIDDITDDQLPNLRVAAGSSSSTAGSDTPTWLDRAHLHLVADMGDATLAPDSSTLPLPPRSCSGDSTDAVHLEVWRGGTDVATKLSLATARGDSSSSALLPVTVTVGRLPTSTLVIDDPRISATHMSICCSSVSGGGGDGEGADGGGGVTVTDSSTNGSYLNGTRLEKGVATPLQDGDVLSAVVWLRHHPLEHQLSAEERDQIIVALVLRNRVAAVDPQPASPPPQRKPNEATPASTASTPVVLGAPAVDQIDLIAARMEGLALHSNAGTAVRAVKAGEALRVDANVARKWKT